MHRAINLGSPCVPRRATIFPAPMSLRVMQVLHQGGGAGSVTSTLHLELGLAPAGGRSGSSARPTPRSRRSPARADSKCVPLALRPAAPGERRRARRADRAASGGPGQLPERSRPGGAHLAGAHRPAARCRWCDPAADAADVLPGELARQPGRRARDRREPRGRGGAPAEGHAAPQAGGDSQRAGGGAGGSPSTRRTWRSGAQRIGWEPGAAHDRHRGPAQGPAVVLAALARGADAGPPGACRRRSPDEPARPRPPGRCRRRTPW